MVPPCATASVPDVIFDASRFGMEEVERVGTSDAARALNDGVPALPEGAANTKFWLWLTSDRVIVEDDVTGEPATENKDGAASPTEVTVPDDAAVHAGRPPTTVKTWPVVPTFRRSREFVPSA